MKVFVVGANGFVGSAIAHQLRGDGHAVAGMARTPNLEHSLRRAGVDPVACDLDTRLSVALVAAEDCDATVFAAQLPPDDEGPVVSEFLEALTDRTFVYLSGTGVFMQRTAGAWSEDSFAEDDAFVPEPLARARVTTEIAVRAATGLRTLVVRPPYLWGPREHGHLSAFYRSYALTGTVCYVGEGLNCYSHLHVQDAARLVTTALTAGTTGALYHGVAGEIPNRWIAEAVANDLGATTRSVTTTEASEIWGDFEALIMSASSRCRSPRTHRELSWHPRHTDLLTMIGAPHLREITRVGPQPDINKPTRTPSVPSGVVIRDDPPSPEVGR